MTDNIVNLDDRRPHQSSYVACLDCGKEWEDRPGPRRDAILAAITGKEPSHD